MRFSGLYTVLTVPVYGILYVYTAIGIFFALFLSWLNVKKPVFFMSRIWAKSVFLLMGKRIHIIGKENINKGEKYILLANHASLFDILAWFGNLEYAFLAKRSQK